MDKKIEVYTTKTCHFCHDLKDFLDEKGITYTEYDVSSDEERREELVKRSNQLGVPVLFVDDEMIIGFNKEKISELLGIKE